jgi:hypothetical protein
MTANDGNAAGEKTRANYAFGGEPHGEQTGSSPAVR